MQLTFFNASDFSIRMKATVHSTGKLGFNEGTARKLNLSIKAGVQFAKDSEETLYIKYMPVADERCFPVQKSGDYYFVNSKPLFDALGVDYTREKIMFDLVSTEQADVYKLVKRVLPRKKNQSN